MALAKSPERGTEAVAPAVVVTEGEIAMVAYRLWLDGGCPEGSSLENWLTAEAILQHAAAGACEEPAECEPLQQRAAGAEFLTLTDLQWEGHWETWEREWGGSRWITG
jgi:hypothetical protein